MGVNSLPKTATRQRRDCDLNPGPSAPDSNTLTSRLPSHPLEEVVKRILKIYLVPKTPVCSIAICFFVCSLYKTC